MIDITQLEDDVFTVLNGITGITTIISHPSDPRPATPYVVFELRDLDQIGREDRGEVDVNGDRIVFAQYEVRLVVQAIGPNSRATATKIRGSLNLDSIVVSFCDIGLAYSRATPVRHIPDIQDTTWEERAVFEIIFHAVDQESENTSYIEIASTQMI